MSFVRSMLLPPPSINLVSFLVAVKIDFNSIDLSKLTSGYKELPRGEINDWFMIANNANSNITFTHNDGKVFKIFAREMTERGREMQQKQKLFTHESKNEETAS